MGHVSHPIAAISLVLAAAHTVAAEPASRFPVKPIRVIVPFAPGGGSDVVARTLGPKLAERLGQPVVIDNRPAASGVVGTDLAAKATPDGHTLLLVTATNAISSQLVPHLPFDLMRDFTAIIEVIASPFGMMLQPSVPAKTVKEFVAYAQANPGKLNYGSSGPGSSPPLATELFMSMTGVRMTHVPYKGISQYVTAQLGNEIQFSFGNMFSTMGHWKAGRLRLVAHGGTKRLEAYPDLPTVSESGVPGYEAVIWYGYVAPARTPRAVVDTLHDEIAAIVRAPDVWQAFVSQGNEPVLSTPAEFNGFIRSEAAKWGGLAKKLGVRVD
ncbi:MAG TPA: tripartite tricarboxylate transporter substrate binding protein [Burkholderiales bacterium]|nr:tripartite tricarboxylate transporter substrate binding protein [Burkholderiales bacterium]